MNLTENRALIFANHWHKGQKRKYTNEPYITHPLSVAQILEDHKVATVEVTCAALLHDVLEDTECTKEEIETSFGHRVAKLVLEVTDVSKPEDGNRAKRKELDRQHLAKASIDGKNIKLADLIHNTQSIVDNDLDFAVVYLREKEKLLEVLKDGGPSLVAKAMEMMDWGQSKVAAYKANHVIEVVPE